MVAGLPDLEVRCQVFHSRIFSWLHIYLFCCLLRRSGSRLLDGSLSRWVYHAHHFRAQACTAPLPFPSTFVPPTRLYPLPCGVSGRATCADPGLVSGFASCLKQWASRRFRGLACTQAVVFMTPEQKMHRADIQSGHSPPRRFASSTPPTEIPGHAASGGRPRRHLRLRASAFDPCHLRARRALHVHEHGGEPTFGLQEAKRTRRKLEEDGMICPCTFAHTLPRLRAPVENGPGCDRQAWVALTGHKNIFRSLPST